MIFNSWGGGVSFVSLLTVNLVCQIKSIHSPLHSRNQNFPKINIKKIEFFALSPLLLHHTYFLEVGQKQIGKF